MEIVENNLNTLLVLILKVKYGKFGIFQNLKNVILLIFKKF